MPHSSVQVSRREEGLSRTLEKFVRIVFPFLFVVFASLESALQFGLRTGATEFWIETTK